MTSVRTCSGRYINDRYTSLYILSSAREYDVHFHLVRAIKDTFVILLNLLDLDISSHLTGFYLTESNYIIYTKLHAPQETTKGSV